MTRIALIADDGTTTVGGVLCKIVPVEPQREMIHSADNMMDGDLAYSDLDSIYRTMLAAVELDLSTLPKVPERKAYVGYGYTVDEDAAWIDGYNECIDLIAPLAPTPNAQGQRAAPGPSAAPQS